VNKIVLSILAAGALVTTALVSASAATERAAAPEFSGTVEVGQILPATNQSGGPAFPTVKKVMNAAVNGFNKRGGLNGKKIVLHLCDSKGDPNAEADCARQMVDDKVAATLNDWAVFNAATTAKILQDAGIPRIGINMVDLSEFSSAVSFPLTSDPVGGGTAEVVGLVKAGNEKVAIVIAQTPTSGVLASLLQPAAEAYGGSIVTTVQVPAGAADYSQYVAAAKKDGATGFAIGLDGPAALQFISAMQQLDDTSQVGLPGKSLSLNQLKKYSSITKKAVIADGVPNGSSSAKKFPFLTDYRRDLKAAGLDLADIDNTGVAAWGSLSAFVTIMQDAPTVDAASTLAAVNAATDVDLQGLIPPWTPAHPGPSPLLPSVTNPFVYLMKYNGKTVQTNTPGIDVLAALSG
jgi:ABC-type branched-subunit amino acid transport system substrate-binding protein